jgi:hypothetical protein
MRRLASLVVMVVMAVAAGCQGDEPANQSSRPDRGPRPDVNLPPVPQISANRPMRHPDGSLTVWALSQQMTEHLGQDVRLTAYARDIYVCEYRNQQAAGDRIIRERLYLTQEEVEQLERERLGTGEGTGGLEERCLYPHLYVADTMTSERMLLVTGYGVPLEQRLRVGEQYVFEGRFLEETRGFNAAGRGLIYVFNISGGSLDLPEGEGDSVRVE